MLMIFSVIGVLLFGNLCVDYLQDLGSDSLSRCTLVDSSHLLQRYANFQNSAYAALALIRVSTGETWSQLMLKVSTTYDQSSRVDNALSRAESFLRARKYEPDVFRRQQLLQSARDVLPGGCEMLSSTSDQVFPGCISSAELNYLREKKLLDCSAPQYLPFEQECSSTCGNNLAKLYFPVVYTLVNLLLLNIVLAVLMRQVGKCNQDFTKMSTINNKLPKHTFVKAVELWRSTALRKIRFEKVLERFNKVIVLQDVDGLGRVLNLKKGEICTLLRVWDRPSHVVLRTADMRVGLCPAHLVSAPVQPQSKGERSSTHRNFFDAEEKASRLGEEDEDDDEDKDDDVRNWRPPSWMSEVQHKPMKGGHIEVASTFVDNEISQKLWESKSNSSMRSGDKYKTLSSDLIFKSEVDDGFGTPTSGDHCQGPSPNTNSSLRTSRDRVSVSFNPIESWLEQERSNADISRYSAKVKMPSKASGE
eukprot:764742-Hanusia_phi.AAC.4